MCVGVCLSEHLPKNSTQFLDMFKNIFCFSIIVIMEMKKCFVLKRLSKRLGLFRLVSRSVLVLLYPKNNYSGCPYLLIV